MKLSYCSMKKSNQESDLKRHHSRMSMGVVFILHYRHLAKGCMEPRKPSRVQTAVGLADKIFLWARPFIALDFPVPTFGCSEETHFCSFFSRLALWCFLDEGEGRAGCGARSHLFNDAFLTSLAPLVCCSLVLFAFCHFAILVFAAPHSWCSGFSEEGSWKARCGAIMPHPFNDALSTRLPASSLVLFAPVYCSFFPQGLAQRKGGLPKTFNRPVHRVRKLSDQA